MDLELEIKAALNEEKILFYSSGDKADDAACGCCGCRGCIGYLRGDFGRGTEFFTTFWDHCTELKTKDFKVELDIVINSLRMPSSLLSDLQAMSVYCYKYPTVKLTEWSDCAYGYKVETDKHSYYIRCNTMRGDYNFYVYCYNKERLTEFLEKSKTQNQTNINENKE